VRVSGGRPRPGDRTGQPGRRQPQPGSPRPWAWLGYPGLTSPPPGMRGAGVRPAHRDRAGQGEGRV